MTHPARALVLLLLGMLAVGALLSGLGAVAATPFATQTVLPTALPTPPGKSVIVPPRWYRHTVVTYRVFLDKFMPLRAPIPAVRPGHPLTFDLTSDKVDTYLRIEDFDDNVLAEDDNSGGAPTAALPTSCRTSHSCSS